MASDSPALDAKAVSQLLNVSVRSVMRLAERGEIVAFKVGGVWRFHRSDVDNYVEEQKRKQQSRKSSTS